MTDTRTAEAEALQTALNKLHASELCFDCQEALQTALTIAGRLAKGTGK